MLCHTIYERLPVLNTEKLYCTTYMYSCVVGFQLSEYYLERNHPKISRYYI